MQKRTIAEVCESCGNTIALQNCNLKPLDNSMFKFTLGHNTMSRQIHSQLATFKNNHEANKWRRCGLQVAGITIVTGLASRWNSKRNWAGHSLLSWLVDTLLTTWNLHFFCIPQSFVELLVTKCVPHIVFLTFRVKNNLTHWLTGSNDVSCHGEAAVLQVPACCRYQLFSAARENTGYVSGLTRLAKLNLKSRQPQNLQNLRLGRAWKVLARVSW